MQIRSLRGKIQRQRGYAFQSVLFLVTIFSILCAVTSKVEFTERKCILKTINTAESPSIQISLEGLLQQIFPCANPLNHHVFFTRPIFHRVRRSQANQDNGGNVMERRGSLNLRDVRGPINPPFYKGILTLGTTIMRRGPLCLC